MQHSGINDNNLNIMVIIMIIIAMTITESITTKNSTTTIIIITRRMPVQRAVERDEIPYPYKAHDTTLRPYKIDHSRA